MNKVIVILGVELLITALFAFLLNDGVIDYNFFTAWGLGNLILGLLGVIIGIVIVMADKEKDNSYLIASGLLLLLGCLTCTFFPFELNAPRSR